MAAIHAVFLHPMAQFRVIQFHNGKKLYQWIANDWQCMGWLEEKE